MQQSRRSAAVWMARPSTTMGLAPSSSARVAAAAATGPAQDMMMGTTCRWFSDKNATTEEPPKEAADEAAKEETAEKANEEAPPAAEAGPSKEEQLEAQVKELKDQLLRSLAEQDNTRRIAQRDVDAASQFAIKSFAKALLDTSDNLSRALEAVPEEMRKDKENHAVLATLYEGIEMTNTGLMKAFEMNGLVKFGAPGETFDPNKHEALYEYVDPEKEVGTIGQLMKPGFMLRDRVLRPAEVGVIKKQ